MRNFLSLSAFVLIASLLTMGCSKTSDQLFDAGSMTASLGGTSFNSSSCYENFVLSTTEDFYITGNGTDGKTFVVLRLRGSKITLGDYNIDGANSARYIVDKAIYDAQSGTITITSDSAGIATSGNFNFNTYNGANVTGSFRAVFKKK
jgi:hypothetical protein